MAGAKVVKQLLTEFDMTSKELALLLDMSPQGLSNKMSRDSFSYADVSKIADILECKLIVKTKDGKEFY